MIEVNLVSIFEVEPLQWGLRGDPFLWREMKEKIMFSKDVKTANDFEKLLNDLFLKLTNSRPENDTQIFVERYNLGGMSSGYVSSEFWLKMGFPMLVDRFKELYGNLKKGSDRRKVSNIMKFKTTKSLLFSYINNNNGLINYEEATKLILDSFPNSKWKKTHWFWYKTQILSPKGKYYNYFSENTKNNISSRKTCISNSTNSLIQELKQHKVQVQKHHEFKNYSEDVEQTIAMALGKVCHHIHPKIVKKITESNLEFINDFKTVCGNLNLESFFYNGSDCLFPGIRRNINKEKIGNWKNNICLIDNMILNDNTFPRHIWTFLSMNKHYDGNTWKKSGLEQFELAHIFGHKTEEKRLEKKVFKQYDETKYPYALFTSASNVILIPNGLMKPTDKFESIKIAFYKRHFDLYGNNLYAEDDFDETYVPKWYSKIEWLQPSLPEDWENKIDNLLNYRKKVLLNKYIVSR